MGIEIAILIVLLLLSAFFSSAETAFLSLERVQLEHRVREGEPGASRVSSLLAAPRRLLSAILLGNNLVNTGAAAVGTLIAADLVSEGAGVVAATIVVTVLLVIFGEVGPKTVALHHSFALSRLYSVPLRMWSWIVAPVVAMLDGLSRLLLRVIGESGAERQVVSVGELRTAIRMGTETGTIEAEESSMMLRALEMERTQVRQIMTPRVSMLTAAADESLEAVAERLSEGGFLRLPVVSGSADNVVGYLHIRDVANAYASAQTHLRARDLMRDVPFESERATVSRAFTTMKQTGAQLLILIDEFGSTSGLVTLEDITEEVVGQIASESGPQGEEVSVRIGGLLHVEGQRSLGDLSEELGVEIRHADAETVGGLVTSVLRRIPEVGETVDYGGYRFTVKSADGRRVSLIALEALPPEFSGSSEAEGVPSEEIPPSKGAAAGEREQP